MDKISSVLADPLCMRDLGVDVFVSGSQKVSACPSGVSLIAPSDRTQHCSETIDSGCMYLDLKRALMNAERGQTPPLHSSRWFFATDQYPPQTAEVQRWG